MVSALTPALHMFAKDLMCFIPYCARDPQCVSNILTYFSIITKNKLFSTDWYELDADWYKIREKMRYHGFEANPVIN